MERAPHAEGLTAALTQRVNYAGLNTGREEAGEELVAELASFTTLAGTGNDEVHPDQLDLLTLINDLDDSE